MNYDDPPEGHPDYYDYYDYNYTGDWGWDTDPKVKVPGFGFVPAKVDAKLNAMTQDFLQEDYSNMDDFSLNLDNVTENMFDHFKCTILNETWQFLYPHIAKLPPEAICSPYWDGASCFPPSLANTVVTIPCMATYFTKRFNTNYNASKRCFGASVWDNQSDYSQCREQCLVDPFLTELEGNLTWDTWEDCYSPRHDRLVTDISEVIYYVGYSISLIALVGAIIIFLSFREMRCLRHKIHIGLFVALIFTDLAWIFAAFIQTFIGSATEHPDYETIISVWCNINVVLRYFHLTTFFWMFLEGLYLFLQVQLPLSLATIKHAHFVLFGWGIPALILTAWCSLKMTVTKGNLLEIKRNKTLLLGDGELDHVETVKDNVFDLVLLCPFISDDDVDFYSYKLPTMLLLAVNSFFLFWIMGIVLSKLHSQTAMDHDRRHLKAAKALVIVIPLFGFTNILTIMGPSDTDYPLAFAIFQSFRAAFLSTTGAVITLPYCYCNSEVRRAVQTRWRRWKMVRNVGYERCRPRASVATNSIFISSQSQFLSAESRKVSMMTTKVDEKFLNVPLATIPTNMPSSNGSSTKGSSTNVSFCDLSQPSAHLDGEP